MPDILTLNDIVWSKEEFFPEEVVAHFSEALPLLTLVSEGSPLRDGITLPTNQILVVCGRNPGRARISNPDLGPLELPLSFPIHVTPRLPGSPRSLLELAADGRRGTDAPPFQFDPNFYVFCADSELTHDWTLVSAEHDDGRSLALVTVNGKTTDHNLFLTWPCDKSFKMRLGLKLAKHSPVKLKRFISYLAKNPGQYVPPSVGASSNVELLFVHKYEAFETILDQNKEVLNVDMFMSVSDVFFKSNVKAEGRFPPVGIDSEPPAEGGLPSSTVAPSAVIKQQKAMEEETRESEDDEDYVYNEPPSTSRLIHFQNSTIKEVQLSNRKDLPERQKPAVPPRKKADFKSLTLINSASSRGAQNNAGDNDGSDYNEVFIPPRLSAEQKPSILPRSNNKKLQLRSVGCIEDVHQGARRHPDQVPGKSKARTLPISRVKNDLPMPLPKGAR